MKTIAREFARTMWRTLEGKNPSVVWHLTHNQNVDSILTEGIDPGYATGKMRVSWVTTEPHREGFILHILDHHGWWVTDLYLLMVTTDGIDLQKHGRGKIWLSRRTIPPIRIHPLGRLATQDTQIQENVCLWSPFSLRWSGDGTTTLLPFGVS